ncbi:lysosomal Pro-X carboxypeptidase-like [Dorcoceras hygrometricum]|uniref:Lysosomal Pro-X carboxypeptidase-like n=1 Tax=Dorcoceras hygrometricum TaxID=472368 RepID=A0A2Z7B8A6_9LAMI|nr:lysosomal Pro-X carboxypeptidase-like [Dorcoceras hygrometricum]
MSASGESSTTMHRLLHASGSHPIPPPDDPKNTASRGPTTIVAPESQFWTCPSDHDSIGYPRMSASGESSTTMHRLLHASRSHPIPPSDDPKTNQYNQDLGLIHSKNGNHLESPNEGSSIDHQVTIYLHAQNITMFPTNETWYFASQILVSNSGGLILILTAQSTRNMFRIHSDY